MNIDHLEAFMYVVHLKSVHKASKALFLSQPTVTARIKTLERELSTNLFIRQGKNLILTSQGKEFIPYAQQILKTLREGKLQLKQQTAQNEIVIGSNVITSQYFIPHAITLWKRAHPQLRFKLTATTNDDLITKLLNHQVDFAFMRLMGNEGIHQEALLDNSVRLIVYPDHPFLKHQKVTVKELAKESLVFFECGAFDWDLIYKLFEVEGIEPNIDFKVDYLEVAKSLIKHKQSIGFLPYLCVKEELEKGELFEVDTTHLLQIKQHIYLSYIEQDAVSLLKDSIKESVQQFNQLD
ncbi:LysR family transcriptional regulator [Rummeliibacillus suwonensis]|uniref:LysR family transcriptional regulator n=1 Tax=Rummeliibacillus suwonensis TaxID=1306154 RepID=UPI0011B5FD15|nr:LysR family transcriptional regulator [Rummeliibacillus suwonensis]MBO2536658.1 LysR family transcriptional regulator [Rummeliibacillus suwonensis]